MRYGWVPDIPDHRDRLFAAAPVTLPDAVDLRPGCPPVYDQGQLGSCTANAIAAALQFDELRQHEPDAKSIPSRLFIYFNERAVENTVKSDAGARIRDGIKTVNRLGACPESMWPYDIAKFATKPPAACYRQARFCQAVSYLRISASVTAMQGCLAAGFPFAAGIAVYESFESAAVARSGVVPMPGPAEKSLGGHAVLIVGYRRAIGRFIGRNSWGAGWGDRGYFSLPNEYLVELGRDFWTIRRTT